MKRFAELAVQFREALGDCLAEILKKRNGLPFISAGYLIGERVDVIVRSFTHTIRLQERAQRFGVAHGYICGFRGTEDEVERVGPNGLDLRHCDDLDKFMGAAEPYVRCTIAFEFEAMGDTRRFGVQTQPEPDESLVRVRPRPEPYSVRFHENRHAVKETHGMMNREKHTVLL